MKKHLPLMLAGALFVVLVPGSARAAEGARAGLSLCGATLAPSLFPFFVLANLLSELGLPDLLGRWLTPLMSKLFRISGYGAQAFLLGICGGYPLGASVVAELRKKGRVARPEAERLLGFCNNSGPAFILGAAGGIFASPKAGLLLYLTHILGALCVAFLFRGRAVSPHPAVPPSTESETFSTAFPRAVTRALTSTLTVCAYVVFFRALLALGQDLLPLPGMWGVLGVGMLELGSGIAAMRGLPLTAENLAIAAFLLGWGGLSVHCQTLGVVAETDIKCARHLAGRALCGVFAGIFTFALGMFLF